MRKNKLNLKKMEIVEKAFVDETTGERIWDNTVEFCGKTFKVCEPNYCGGIIEENCKILENEFEIIDTFDLKYLEKLESEIKYMQDLIHTRRTELLPIETKTKLIVDRYKEGNKKLCSITVKQYNEQKDIYGDINSTNYKILEDYEYSDTKAEQENINKKIEELKNKYSL